MGVDRGSVMTDRCWSPSAAGFAGGGIQGQYISKPSALYTPHASKAVHALQGAAPGNPSRNLRPGGVPMRRRGVGNPPGWPSLWLDPKLSGGSHGSRESVSAGSPLAGSSRSLPALGKPGQGCWSSPTFSRVPSRPATGSILGAAAASSSPSGHGTGLRDVFGGGGVSGSAGHHGALRSASAPDMLARRLEGTPDADPNADELRPKVKGVVSQVRKETRPPPYAGGFSNGFSRDSAQLRDSRAAQPSGTDLQSLRNLRPQKNSSVWQRFQVSVPSNRNHREQVLERDRQRSRSEMMNYQRDVSMRSTTATLFWTHLTGSDNVPVFMQPGAFRRNRWLSQPSHQEDGMGMLSKGESMKSDVGGSASFSSRGGETPQGGIQKESSPAGRLATASEGAAEPQGKRPPPTKLPPSTEFAFSDLEAIELSDCIDQFAALISSAGDGPDFVSPENDAAPDPAPSRALRRKRTVAVNEIHSSEGPMVLRPVFCRFLLASKLCGAPESPQNYHKLLASFDLHAVQVGIFMGMQRGALARLIAAALVPPPKDPNNKGLEEDLNRQSNTAVSQFFQHQLPAALEHCRCRQKRLDQHKAELQDTDPPSPTNANAFMAQDVGNQGPSFGDDSSQGPKQQVTTASAEEGSGDIMWPPLPPRSLSERDLPSWMTNIRQWKEEMTQHTTNRLHALRAHTETVLRGELLSSQLLEPEVLHFAERFRPVFASLYTAYADRAAQNTRSRARIGRRPSAVERPRAGSIGSSMWIGPSPLSTFRHMEDTLPMARRPSQDTQGPSLAAAMDSSMSLGRFEAGGSHMPFASFFRFCVDFRIFPRYASFEEIRQIYEDSETVLRQREQEAIRRRSEEQAAEAAAAAAQAAATAAAAAGVSGRRPSLGAGGSGAPNSTAIPLQGSQPGALSLAMGPTASISQRGGKTNQKVALAVAAAIKAAEDAMPRVDLAFFDKPLADMSSMEIQTLAYFASVDEWLGEQFLRLSDLIGEPREDSVKGSARSPITEAAAAAAFAALKASNEGGGGGGGAAPQPAAAGPVSPAGMPRVTRRPSIGMEPMDPNRALNAAICAKALESVPKVVCVSPQKLLEVTARMSALRKPRLEDIEAMYRLLLVNQGGTDPVPDIPVFQLDKVLRRARQVQEGSRQSCSVMLRPWKLMSTTERKCCRFIEAFNEKLLEGARLTGDPQDIFEGCAEVTAEEFLDKASELGVDEALYPKQRDLALFIAAASGRRSGGISRPFAFHLLAVTQEAQSRRKRQALRARLQCLAHMPSSEEKPVVFSLAAFVECLLKLALHCLGSKGTTEVMRRAPAWWKCAWLLTLFSGAFDEQIALHHYEKRIHGWAYEPGSLDLGPDEASSGDMTDRASSMEGMSVRGAAADRGLSAQQVAERTALAAEAATRSANEPDVPARSQADGHSWWLRVQMGKLPVYVPPLDRLVVESPSMFEPSFAEMDLQGRSPKPVDGRPCSLCGESRSAYGWGAPSCPTCSGVEDQCMPVEHHIFSALLWTSGDGSEGTESMSDSDDESGLDDDDDQEGDEESSSTADDVEEV